MHQLEPNSGEIFIDNIPLKDIKKTSLQAAFSLNEQVPLLFYGTIRDNVLFGLEDVDENKINEVIEIAQDKDFIESKNEKL